ncbi:hypothetical protein CFC21_104089, partial [Triticum aestivum]
KFQCKACFLLRRGFCYVHVELSVKLR